MTQKKTVAASSNAISIATISDIEGEVDIKLCTSANSCLLEAFELFSGNIDLEKGVLSICFMGDEKVASLETKIGSSFINIYGNNERYPNSVVIIVA